MPCSNRILIVEDEAAIRETLDLMLRMEGYEVETASNGREAFAVLSRIPPPCLILLDLMMPVMNGFEFAAEIQKREGLASIPVVVLTAFTDRTDEVVGARRVLGKPIEFDLLFQTLKEFCG